MVALGAGIQELLLWFYTALAALSCSGDVYNLFPHIKTVPDKVGLHVQVVEACMARLQEQALSTGLETSTSLQFSTPGRPAMLAE